MRATATALAGISMTIGLAIFGFVSPSLGVVLLFGGAALYLVADKKTIAIIERMLASKERRQALDEGEVRRQHVQDQFQSLSSAEKEAVKHVKQNGHISAGQVATHLASCGFADPGGIVDSVRGKTPFLLGSFSGEFSINPELRECLDEVLNPPLYGPVVRLIVLLVIVAAVLGIGFLFRRYMYPADVHTNPTASLSTPPSPVELPKQNESPHPPAPRVGRRSKKDTVNADSSGTVGGDQTAGPCSNVFNGGSGNQGTVNCEDVPPQVTTIKLGENVPTNGLFETAFRLTIVAKHAFLLHVRATAPNVVSMAIDDIRPPEQGGKAFQSTDTSGPDYLERDFRDIESGAYVITVRTAQPNHVRLESR